MLGLTLITTVYDAHLVSQTRQDALRLEQVNAALQHGKNLLTLATRAAGIDTSANPDAITAMIHGEDRTIRCDAVRKAVAEGRDVCAFRFRVVTPAGAIVHLQAHARIFCNEGGEPIRILGVSWDVTDEVLHEDSLGVSASLVQSRLRNSRVGNLKRMADLLLSQGDQAGRFLESDERGRELPGYLGQLGANLVAENEQLRAEAAAITAHVGHIRNIVAAQQTYARRGGVTEAVDIPELLDNAAAIHFADTTDITVRREYDGVVPLTLDRHKLIQILGNLLSNARHALKNHTQAKRQLVLRVQTHTDSILVEVEDSGVGISAEVLHRLFEFGFTTKKDGHGFGLHTSSILAKELGGELTAHSDGADRGARFSLRLPSSANETAGTFNAAVNAAR